jgi:hypothetical protein
MIEGVSTMQQLLASHSITEIISFVVLLALAFKGVTTYVDWFKDRGKKWVLSSLKPEELAKKLEEEVTMREKEIARLEDNTNKLKSELDMVMEKLDLLIRSDKDDIKAWITKEYHYFVEQKGWIDDYSLDCIERRYENYKEENGNSFVKDLMYELRRLPKSAPEDR